LKISFISVPRKAADYILVDFRCFSTTLDRSGRLTWERLVSERLGVGYREAVNEGARGLRPALILDADLRQSLVTVRSLGRAGVTVHVAETHARAPAFASRWCASRTLVPDFARDPAGFVEHVSALCESIGRPVLITSHDGSIEALRARRDDIERVATLALAPEQALALAIDKRATLAAAERLGLNVPPGTTVTDLTSMREALDAVELPIVVKPAVSWVNAGPTAWRAAPTLARTREDAIEKVTSLVEGGVGALLQPWLPGTREAVSVLFANGVMWATFAQRADRMYPLLGGSSVLRESITVPEDIGPMAEALIRELSLDGYSEIEFRRDAAGRPFLMEINSRLSASVEIAVRAGVDFPLLLYEWAAEQRICPVRSYRCGCRMRYLKGDVSWLKDALRDPQHPDAPRPAVAIASFLAAFGRRTGYDYWDRNDPAPAVLVASRVARSLPGRIARAVRPTSLTAVPGEEA
jgi:predicted ATP-grasp superfamily ATP-dependent carboligase